MMKKKIVSTLLVGCMTAALFAGCGTSSTSSSETSTSSTSSSATSAESASSSATSTAETTSSASSSENTEAVSSSSASASSSTDEYADATVLTAEDAGDLKPYDFDLTDLGENAATELDDSVTDGDWVIGYSEYFTGNSWKQQLDKEFEVMAEKYKQEGIISDYIMTNANNDQTKQISDIEDLITQGVDAIVVTAITSDALNDVLEEAQEEGILVFNCDNQVSCDVTSRIVISDYDFGYESGYWLGEQLSEPGNIVLLDGTAGTSTDTNRHDGMVDGLAASSPDSEIIVQENADWDYAEASTAMGTILSANQDIDGVLSQGGAMTMAAVDAFVAAGRDLVPMTGEASNGYLRVWSEYKDEGFSSMAFSNPAFQGVLCLNLAVNALNGVEIDTAYKLQIPNIEDDDIEKLYCPDLSDSFWVFSTLSEDEVKELFAEE